MQGLYVWNLHEIRPNLNKSYIQQAEPELVLLDNLARGFVLQMTDIMQPDQQVLVADSTFIAESFRNRHLVEFGRILYLPMDTTVKEGKAHVLKAARDSGRTVLELPVVHAGMFEAVLIGNVQAN
jgi:hypothetical protein